MRRTATWSLASLAGVALLVAGCGTGTSAAGGGGGSSAGGSSPRTASSDAAPSSTSPAPSPASSTPSGSSASSGGGGDSGGAVRVKHRCHTAQLDPAVRPRHPAAGHRHALIVLTNDSDTACTVYGYGGMQLYDADGHRVPTDLVRNPSRGPVTLTVRPGDSVYSVIAWSAVPQGDEPVRAPCEPGAATARVTPPDETTTRPADWHYGPVCDHGRIEQGAYRAAP